MIYKNSFSMHHAFLVRQPDQCRLVALATAPEHAGRLKDRKTARKCAVLERKTVGAQQKDSALVTASAEHEG
eukprot:SAG22_NODE_7160_length_770_cov_0.715350_2_plen_71_part_01